MANVSLIDGHLDNAEHCVCRGQVIPEGRQHCIICGKKVNGKQRQIDRIRNMSVEELAEFMYSAPDKICFENCTKETGNKYSCKFGENVDISECKKCMKEWLEQEVSE